MRKFKLLVLTLGTSAGTLLAQQPPGAPPGPGGPGGPGGPPGPMHGPPPLMAALDTNRDGELDAAEIANASAALLKLDKNGDGKLTPDELMPQPGGGTNRFRPPPMRGGRLPVSPLMAALDTNGDGILDAGEIANASASLLKLDTNGDGKLSRDELRPKHHGPPPGPGGAEGQGAPAGPPPDGPPPGGPDEPSQPAPPDEP